MFIWFKITPRNANSSEVVAVDTFKMIYDSYHYLINHQTYGLTQQSMEEIEYGKSFVLVTCLDFGYHSLFENST